MNKLLAAASEIAKKGTFHAHHNRISEAVYLYQLSIKFMDHIIEGCARDPTAFPEQSLEIVKRSREGYMNFVRAHSEYLPHNQQQQLRDSSSSSSAPPSPGVPNSPSPLIQPMTASQEQDQQLQSQQKQHTQMSIRPPTQPQRPVSKATPPMNPRSSLSTATVEQGLTKPRNRLSLPGTTVTTTTTVGAAAGTAGAPPPLPAPIAQQQLQPQQSQPLRSSASLSSNSGITKQKQALPFRDESSQPRVQTRTPLTTSDNPVGTLTSSDANDDNNNSSNNGNDDNDDDDEDDPLVLIKRAVEEKRANNLNGSIQTYERVIELLMQENKELKTKVEQQQSQIKTLNQSQSSSSSSSHRSMQPITTASAHEGSRSRGHLLKRSSAGNSSSSSNFNLSTNDLISALENTTNTSNIDYVNDKVDFHERLGGGGSGTVVFRATCKGLTFAAKVLPGEMPPEVRDGVLSEIHVMTRLDHQNVAKYLGHDLSKPKKIMLFMEYYTETLAGVLKKRKDEDAWTTPEEVTKWSMQIAKGLQYLHSLSPPLIHRDLKSENVFVLYDSQGRVETLKIGDFDTAKITEKTKATFTRNLGTVGFMAPEVCNPTEKGYNEKADSKKLLRHHYVINLSFHFLKL